jgi:hypothetical protein
MEERQGRLAKILNMGMEETIPPARTIPSFLQREETAAQIVALMQTRFDRPGPDEMREILRCAEQQIAGLHLP